MLMTKIALKTWREESVVFDEPGGMRACFATQYNCPNE